MEPAEVTTSKMKSSFATAIVITPGIILSSEILAGPAEFECIHGHVTRVAFELTPILSTVLHVSFIKELADARGFAHVVIGYRDQK